MGLASRSIGFERVTLAAAANIAAAGSVAAPMPRRHPVGGAGTSIWGGTIDDTDPNIDVRGALWYGTPGRIGIAGTMMRDPHVRQSVNAVSSPLRAATWTFRPVDGSPLAREVARFCDYVFLHSLPWDRIVRRVVNGYTSNGFALEEMTDDTRDIPVDRFPLHPGNGRGLVPTAFYDRPAWSVFEWGQDPKNPSQLRSVTQQLQGSDGEPGRFQRIDASRLLRWTYDQEGANFEGLPILRSAFGDWKLKQAFKTILAIALERTGVSIPVLTEGEETSDADREAAELALAELRAHEKAYLYLPNDFDFEWSGGGESDAANLIAAIEMSDKGIAFNVGAGFTLLGLQGKSGSYALGSTLESHYHLSTEGHAAFFTEVFNFGSDGWSPVRRIVDHNYGPDVESPRLEARNLPTKDWASTVKLLALAKQGGLVGYDRPMEERIRAVLQFDPIDDETYVEPKTIEGPAEPAESTAIDQDADGEPAPRDEDQE